MNVAYPIPEILKCIEIINQSKNEFYKINDETFNLKDKIND